MSEISNISQYLDAVCSRIQCKEVHPDVRLELEGHLQEIMQEEIKNGASEPEAVHTAISCMGDPATLGISLDKIHKPKLEWSLLALLGGFLCISAFTMYSLVGFVPEWVGVFPNTILSAKIGVILAVSLYFIDYRRIVKLAPYLAGFILLVLVLALESRVWIYGMRAEASASLYLLAIGCAVILTKYNRDTEKDLLITASAVIVPAVILIAQPSLAAAAVYIAAAFVMLLSTRPDKKRIVMGAVVLVLVLSLMVFSFRPYAWARLMVFLTPNQDPSGAGWPYLALMNAIQQGGPFGQRALAVPGVLPEPHTDFVLAYLIYRYGWVTGAALIILCGLFIYRLVKVCLRLREPLARTTAIGISTILSAQFVGNILISLGKAPMVAIPLPFISYSRLSLVAEVAAVGLMLGMYRIKDMINSAPEAPPNEQQA